MPQEHDSAYDVLRTYRYLRLAMVLLVLMLGGALLLQIVADDGELEQSISAYYYTPVRSVFVAALCAIGTCLIVHRGRSDLEDVLLNAAGFLAFFVAFVPTRPETDCVPDDLAKEVTDAITNNTWAILAAGLVAFVVALFLVPPDERSVRTTASRIALGASVLVYVGLAVFFIGFPDQFTCYGHNTAAISLFVGVVAVVVLNALALARRRAAHSGRSVRSHLLNRYSVGFLVMLAAAAVVGVLAGGGLAEWVFWLEAVLIAGFLGFWLMQTFELWQGEESEQEEFMPG